MAAKAKAKRGSKPATPSPPRKRAPRAAKPVAPPPPPPPPPASGDGYGQHRESMAFASRARSAKGREIGGIPDIADPDRRVGCRDSLQLFCETYNPDAFALGWSPDHLGAIARIQEAVTLGALYAFAMARGSGKTTICRMAALWAAAYAHCRYAFLIGATDAKAKETLDTLRVLIRFLPTFADDFPEISWPARCLAGIANRATGQTCEGESTLIEWSADKLVLPTVPPPANWPKGWPLRHDGLVPTSGVVVSASGLTGEGIRGSLKTLTTGEMVRPDFVLLDDPQTPESARSITQNEHRLKLVSADVLGMAGPGAAIAAVMPCTVIEPGDMVDEVLDREKHPLWRGERSGILRSMPTNLAAWDAYFESYARCAQLEPPDFTESNGYYLAHRDALEAGAVASWPERKEAGEISAIQHAMHRYFRDRRAFWAEFMNRPERVTRAAAGAITAEIVAAKTTALERGTVLRAATRLTAMIDVGAHLLWWMVCAWDERFGGAIVDYGVFPEQRRAYFAKADPRPGLTQLPQFKDLSSTAAIYAGLTAVTDLVLGRVYPQEGTGAEYRVECCPIDANWGPATDLVYEFCRRSKFASVLLPAHGKGLGVSAAPMSTWQKRDGERPGWHWRLAAGSTGRGRHLTVDVNHWKTFAADRIRSPGGAPGCVWLCAPPAGGHRLLGDHLAAEVPIAVTRKDGSLAVDEWRLQPGRDNDWFDCFVGCCVGASVQGLVWSAGEAAGLAGRPGAPPPRVKLSDLQRRKRQARSKSS